MNVLVGADGDNSRVRDLANISLMSRPSYPSYPSCSSPSVSPLMPLLFLTASLSQPNVSGLTLLACVDRLDSHEFSIRSMSAAHAKRMHPNAEGLSARHMKEA